MRKKIRTLWITILFSLCMVLSGVAVISLPGKTVFASTAWSEVELKEEYMQGEELTIPDRVLTVNGKNVAADATVIFPNGTTTISKTIVLDMAGIYTIQYTAYEGRVYSINETITVKYKAVTSYSEESSYSYGAHELASTQEGLVVRLAEYDTLVFNQIIDMNNKTRYDTLLEFFVTPNQPGIYDFEKLFVQFTDITNEENFLKMRFIRSYGGVSHAVTYLLAGGNDQPMSGYESGHGKLHVDNSYGTPGSHNFAGVTPQGEVSVGKDKVSISYDSATKSVYFNDRFVIDLDDSKYYRNLWSGFESGKVKMTIWAGDYLSMTANFVITQCPDGVDLSKELLEETTPPAITVDASYDASAMPQAKVGIPYPIPKATAVDDYSGACSVSTQVYYNYLTSPSSVNMQDGMFTPKNAGLYAIVYTAKDYMGNVSESVYWVNCSANLAPPTVVLEEDLPKEVFAGEWISFPDYNVLGGSGNSEVKIYVDDGVTKTECKDGFLANRQGVHKVIFSATDYIGQVGETEYQINVKVGSHPVFVDKPIYPKYLIGGANYVLPTLYANDYSSGELVRKLATVTVTDVNGERTIADGETYIPEVANNFDLVKIVYEVEGVTYVLEIPTVKAKDDSGVYAGNYFALEGASLTLGDDFATITATAEDSKWTFANALLVEDLEVVLEADIDHSSFAGLKITYTDSVDENVSITAELLKQQNASVFKTDVSTIDVQAGFTKDSATNRFTIGYQSGAFVINGIQVAIKNRNNGDAFIGFDSKKVYVTVEWIDATVGAAYRVVELNSQKINTATVDRVAAKVVVLGERGGTIDINTYAYLPAALTGDTLDPNSTFSVRVTAPDFSVVTSKDGIVLDGVDPTRAYEILLTQYGQYKVTYTAMDTFSGRRTTMVYAINVEDCVAPTLIFDNQFQSVVRVGDLIGIPNFSVTDNYDTSDLIVVSKYCVTPSGYIMKMDSEQNTVKTTQAGMYQFRILVSDTAGNVTMCRVNVAAVA